MGWLFGCFGGSRNKDRKQRQSVSPLPTQQKPLPTVSLRAPVPSSSAISIKAFPARDESNNQDLFSARQVSSSAPIQQAAYLHSRAGVQVAEREQKPGPWHQLDGLEEELNDLRKQIHRESHDANKSKKEVHCLKSNDSVGKSPTKLKYQQISVQEARWRSWLAPATSSVARRIPEKGFEGLKLALREHSPAKESHRSSLRIHQAPTQEKPLQNTIIQGTVQVNAHEKSTNANCMVSPSRFPWDNQRLPDSNCAPRNIDYTDSTGMLETPLDRQCNTLQGASPYLSATKSSFLTNAAEYESALMKKRRLVVNSDSTEPPQAIKQAAKDDASGSENHNILGQKRMKLTPSGGEQDEAEVKINSLRPVDHIPMHFFRCDSLSPITESRGSSEAPSNSDSEDNSHGRLDEQQSLGNSCSFGMSLSPSSKQSLAYQAKSASFGATNGEEYSTDEFSHSHGGRYVKEHDLETASYSPSIDSEETLSDLSPERCYSPPISPGLEKSVMNRTLNISNSRMRRSTACHYSIQHLLPTESRNKQQASRYVGQEEETNEDENELFTDAMSHVSTEHSERDNWKQHSHTESIDSVSVQMAQLTDALDTPPKQCDWIQTPNIHIERKLINRIRTKTDSSVLTPVENVSQWKELKNRDQKQNRAQRVDCYVICTSKNAVKKLEGADENKNLIWVSEDNGQHQSHNNVPVCVATSLSPWNVASEPEAIHANVNASLSQWGIAPRRGSFQRDQTVEPADSSIMNGSISQRGQAGKPDPVRVDMSLSHWLNVSSKHNEAQMSVSTSSECSSPCGGGVTSLAQAAGHLVSCTPKQMERWPSVYTASERSKLGMGFSEKIKPRLPSDDWDIPNPTMKNIDGQRTNWDSNYMSKEQKKL